MKNKRLYEQAVNGRQDFREALHIKRLESDKLKEENDRLREILSGLVSDVSNLLSDHDIEWQQAGYFNEAKLFLTELKQQ